MTSSQDASLQFAAELSQTIGRIYDCTLDAAKWPQTLKAVGDYIGGNRARMFLFDSHAAARADGTSFGVDRDFNVAFDRDAETLASIKYGFVVAELDEALTLSEILGVTGGRDVNGRLPFDNRFYREWMAPRDAHDALVVLLFKSARRFGGLAMTRSSPLPPFGRLEKEKIRLLAPHLRRALTIADLIGERSLERDRFADVIEALVVAVAIVDAKGLILHANASARALLEKRTVVAADHGALRALDPAAREPLKAALAGASSRKATTVALAGREAAGTVATLLPLGAELAGGAATTAVFFHNGGEAAPLPGEAFAKLYKLTGTELRVTLLLVEGASAEEIAARLGSGAETVRWHIKNLRTKTGSARTRDLVRLAAQSAFPVTVTASPAATIPAH